MNQILKKLKILLQYKNPVYNFLLEKKSSGEILFFPENLWTGDSENGKKIVEGFLNFNGELVKFKDHIWEKNNATKFWNEQLHSFEWVRDVRAVGTNKARIFLRKNIKEWLKKFRKWDSFSWKVDILSKRICFLLNNLSFFYNTADDDFQREFSKTLNKQSNHLINIHNRETDSSTRIYIVKSIIISSLCFKNLRNKFDFGIILLRKILKTDVLDDGMHYLRSPSEHFFFLKSLLDIKSFLGISKNKIPYELNEKIVKMCAALKFFKISSTELSIFNKYDFIKEVELNEVIKRSNSKTKTPQSLKSSFFEKISENRLIFIMDCGSPTMEKTHAGSLSFEFSHINEKIVVNSGSPFIYNKELGEAMRSTAAHSTVNIDNINSSDIFFDRNTTTRIAKVWSERLEEKNSFWINSAHSGYKDLFGIIHNRKIHIDTEGLVIRGQDYFSQPKKSYGKLPKKINLRFHIHPDIKLNVTTSKKKVVLKLKNNLGWEFICSEPRIEIKEGIYFGNKKKQKNNHILISQKIIPEKKIKWLFRLIK
ncbi:MAG: hypothetical protein CMM95_02245 [Rickettsiales bacterium]|nr:hypothetical protein [Rickettsiales bacterium]